MEEAVHQKDLERAQVGGFMRDHPRLVGLTVQDPKTGWVQETTEDLSELLRQLIGQISLAKGTNNDTCGVFVAEHRNAYERVRHVN
jgi:hypothetical protein